MTPTEHEIQNAVIDYLRMRGHCVIRVNSGLVKVSESRFVRLAEAGTSDLVVCEKGTGKFWAIEVKRPKQKPTPQQIYFMTKVNCIGGKSLVVTSIEDAQRVGL